MRRATVGVLFVLTVSASDVAIAQTTDVKTEYLMTYSVPLERHPVDGSLVVVNVKPGGWVKGPQISGNVIPPAAIGLGQCRQEPFGWMFGSLSRPTMARRYT